MTMSSPAAGAVMALARTPAVASRYDLTPRAAVLCASITLAAITALDLLDGRLGVVYAVGFVVTVLSAATAVTDRGFFTMILMPPVLYAASLLIVAIVEPDAIVVAGLPESAGLFVVTLAALLDQALALTIGHLLVIAMVVGRFASLRR